MLLTILVFMPAVFAALFCVVKKDAHLKNLAIGTSFVHFLYSGFIFYRYDFTVGSYQLIEKFLLFDPLGFYYALGVDGLSLCLVLLSTFLFFIALLGAGKTSKKNLKNYFISLFLIQSAVMGAFLSIDLILFYTFFEASIILMLFIIGIWGGSNKIYAAKKFFLYMFTSSILLLGAILTMIVLFESVNGQPSALLADLETIQLPFIKNSVFSTQTVLFFGFLLSFIVKAPLFPSHTWFPDVHREAPIMGAVLLSGSMISMSAYGMIRFIPSFFPQASEQYAWLICILALIGIVYGALVAFAQVDIRKLIAYSSISQIGYVVLGVFSFNIYGLLGASFQVLSHGLNVVALFLLVNFLYGQTKTYKIEDYGGLATLMPRYSAIFHVVAFSIIAVPLTNGFIGQFLILKGAFQANPIYGIIAILGLVLGAAYMLHMIKRVFYGTVQTRLENANLKDLGYFDFLTYGPILVLVFIMGVYPKPVLDRLDLRVFVETAVESEAVNDGQ